MFDSAIMSNTYLIAFAKQNELLQDLSSLVEFLKPWYKIEEHVPKIFKYI